MLDHRRDEPVFTETSGDAATHFGAEPAPEVLHRVARRAGAQARERLCGNEQARVGPGYQDAPSVESTARNGSDRRAGTWLERTRERFCEYTRCVRRAVKCGAWFFGRTLPVCAICGLAVGATGRSAEAQLLTGVSGSSKERPPPALDPHIPKGALRARVARPTATSEPPACSVKYPLCLRRGGSVDDPTAMAWLGALESAYERVVLCLGAPVPLDDSNRGGSPALDTYLMHGDHALAVEADPAVLGASHDTASAFCVVGDGEPAVDRAATLCIAEAVALRLDASETPFARRAFAAEVWLHSGTPTSADAQAIDDVQAEPERAIAARDRSRFSEGGALLFEYLGATRGRGAGIDAVLATYALSAGPSSPAGPRWVNEPDTMDVLRATFGPTPSDVARFFGDFAFARAFIGSRDAASAWPLLRWVGDFGRVRFDWSVPFSSLPRRLSPARPVEPTGSTYFWVTLDGAAAGRSIAFQADWEPPVSFRWVLAVIAADGHVVRRIDVPYLERETHIERIVGDLSGGAGLLASGINLGGLGPTYPFDPDYEPYEPHACTVYFAAQ